jgi:hypothetical protein
MTRESLVELVRSYFSGVDSENIDQIFSTLTMDCRFSIETHGVELNGYKEIRGMFDRLWFRHSAVQHDNLRFVVDPAAGKISTQFRVVNTFNNGEKAYKSNCNFFTTRDRLFDTVAVYMAGENTLVQDD